tara:strand:+ start:380 stop:1477 length:1098 start_codon:yes stop_codon:yes gene_type:complete
MEVKMNETQEPTTTENQEPNNEIMRDKEKDVNVNEHKNIDDFSLFDFAIEEIPLEYTWKGEKRKAENRRIIVRGDNGNFLGDVGRRYKLVPHKEMVKDFTKQLKKKDVDLSDISVTDRIFENGSKATRTIIWNNIRHNVGTKTKEDWVNMRLDVANSVNGDWSFQAFVGAFREMCLNTLVFGGEKWYHEKTKHMVGIDTFASAEKCVKTISLFENRMEDLKKWRTTPVEDKWVMNFFKFTLAQRSRKSHLLEKEIGKEISQRKLDYLMYLYEREIKSLGKTLFAVYMAITHWSSHLKGEFDKEVKQKDGSYKTITYRTYKEGSATHNVERDRRNLVSQSLEHPIWLVLIKPSKTKEDINILNGGL